MNNEQKTPRALVSITDDFEQLMMTDSINPLSKCLIKQLKNGLEEHLHRAEDRIKELKDELQMHIKSSETVIIGKNIEIERLTSLNENSKSPIQTIVECIKDKDKIVPYEDVEKRD